VPPKNQKRGRVASISNPPRVGPNTPANPKPTGVGKTGVQGAKPPAGGCGGCAPFTPTEVSLFEKGRPSPTLIKAGVEGAQPPPRGLGDVPPKNQKRGRVAPISNPPRVGPNTPANPKPTGVGKTGVQGAKPPGRGLGGVPPQIQKRERVAPLSNPATSGTQYAGKP
jgi:hypothetical protein